MQHQSSIKLNTIPLLNIWLGNEIWFPPSSSNKKTLISMLSDRIGIYYISQFTGLKISDMEIIVIFQVNPDKPIFDKSSLS